MITEKNLVHHEFIGLNVSVTNPNNKSFSLTGRVIDETKNTLRIEVERKNGKPEEKIIPKKGSIFLFTLPNGKWVEINGDILSIRPEDRIKKRFKKI